MCDHTKDTKILIDLWGGNISWIGTNSLRGTNRCWFKFNISVQSADKLLMSSSGSHWTVMTQQKHNAFIFISAYNPDLNTQTRHQERLEIQSLRHVDTSQTTRWRVELKHGGRPWVQMSSVQSVRWVICLSICVCVCELKIKVRPRSARLSFSCSLRRIDRNRNMKVYLVLLLLLPLCSGTVIYWSVWGEGASQE